MTIEPSTGLSTPVPDHGGTIPWLDRYTSTSGEILTEIGCTPLQVVAFGTAWEERCWPILAEAIGFDDSQEPPRRRDDVAPIRPADERALRVQIDQLTRAHAEALADNERVVRDIAVLMLAVEQLKAERDRAIAQRNAMAAIDELTTGTATSRLPRSERQAGQDGPEVGAVGVDGPEAVRHRCRKWILLGRQGVGAGEYGEAARIVLTLLDGTVWCETRRCDGHTAGTEGMPCLPTLRTVDHA